MPEHTPRIVTLSPQPVALLRETVPLNALTDFFDRAFHTVAEAVQAQGASFSGPPVGVYYAMPSDTVDVGAGFPTDRPIEAGDAVTPDTLPGGLAAQVVHEGSYDTMEQTYARLMAWLGEEGLTPGPLMWESYLTEPDDEHPESTQTLIVWPLV